jgi:hypothetical protein
MKWKDIEALTQATIDQVKESFSKSITTSTGLAGVDLSGPAYELYPVLTPYRNSIPRTRAPKGSTASQWKQITSVRVTTKPGVAAGTAQRRPDLHGCEPRTAVYKTIGYDDDVVWEARVSGPRLPGQPGAVGGQFAPPGDARRGAHDLWRERQPGAGCDPHPHVCAAVTTAGATLPAATYKVYCVALTYWGIQFATTGAPLALPTVLVGTNAGKSAVAAQAIRDARSRRCACRHARRPALAYAWYVGTVGAEKLEAVTAFNSYVITAPLAATGQNASAIADTDNSTDPLDYDGLRWPRLTTAAPGGYVKTLPTGTVGVGSKLDRRRQGQASSKSTTCSSTCGMRPRRPGRDPRELPADARHQHARS